MAYFGPRICPRLESKLFIFGIDDLIIGGLIAAGGSIAGGAIGADAQSEANSANLQWERERFAAQREMAAWAHRTEFTDLRAAGINPMLAVTKGAGGAAVPSGGSANQVPVDAMAKGLSAASHSALEMAQMKKQFESVDADISLKKAQEETQHAITESNLNSAKESAQRTKQLEAQYGAVKSGAELDQERNRIDRNMLVPDAILNRARQVTGIASDAAGILKPKIQIGGRPWFGGGGSENDRLHRAGSRGIPVGRRPLP